jgi:hypothetical protein
MNVDETTRHAPQRPPLLRPAVPSSCARDWRCGLRLCKLVLHFARGRLVQAILFLVKLLPILFRPCSTFTRHRATLLKEGLIVVTWNVRCVQYLQFPPDLIKTGHLILSKCHDIASTIAYNSLRRIRQAIRNMSVTMYVFHMLSPTTNFTTYPSGIMMSKITSRPNWQLVCSL